MAEAMLDSMAQDLLAKESGGPPPSERLSLRKPKPSRLIKCAILDTQSHDANCCNLPP
jgi:hypothetical protein